MSFGNRKVLKGERTPLSGRARLVFQQMRNGKPGPEHGAIALIEGDQFRRRRRLREHRRQPAQDVIADPAAIIAFTFDRQESGFLKGVYGAQPGIEFQAIYDRHGAIDEDVLRPQIAMAVHYSPGTLPFMNETAVPLQKHPLGMIHAQHGRCRQLQPEHNIAVDAQKIPPFGNRSSAGKPRRP